MLVTRRKPDEALAWAERGISLDQENPHGWTTAGYEPSGLHRELLTMLGRGNEAIEAAWADFREDPGKYSYDELMKFVPKTGRAACHAKAMDAAAKGDDLHSLIELFIETKEMKRLAELVRGATDEALERVSEEALPRPRALGRRSVRPTPPQCPARISNHSPKKVPAAERPLPAPDRTSRSF